MKRLILGLFAIFSVFFLPWWVVFVLSLALIFYFDRFYEIIIISIIADVLYGSIYTLNFPYPITIGSILLLIIVSSLKKNLISY